MTEMGHVITSSVSLRSSLDAKTLSRNAGIVIIILQMHVKYYALNQVPGMQMLLCDSTSHSPSIHSSTEIIKTYI